jgi:hypothetical protein
VVAVAPRAVNAARAGGDVLHVSCGTFLLALNVLTGDVLWSHDLGYVAYGFASTGDRLFVQSESTSY